MVNYTKSVLKMSAIIENNKFLNEVRELGIKERWLTETKNKDNYRLIAAEGSKNMDPLNGLYTRPEIADVFAKFGESKQLSGAMKNYLAANAFVKYSKTVLSPVTHVRNFVSNTGFAVANGHFRADKMYGAGKSVIFDMFSKDKGKMREELNEYAELGLIDGSIYAGEMKDVIKDVIKSGYDGAKFNETRIKRYIKATGKLPIELYRAEDNVWKIYGYKN
jgi:hypothetical protein